MHADRCIAKITNFITTISCFPDPFHPNAFTVKVDTLHLPEMSPRHAKKCNMTSAEAVQLFNHNAGNYGFQKRITIKDFEKQVKLCRPHPSKTNVLKRSSKTSPASARMENAA